MNKGGEWMCLIKLDTKKFYEWFNHETLKGYLENYLLKWRRMDGRSKVGNGRVTLHASFI